MRGTGTHPIDMARRRRAPTSVRSSANRADVAALAGVSPTTVTNVLAGKGYAGADVRRRVLDAVVHLGYEPNLIARGLATKRSGQVAILVEDMANPYMAEIVVHLTSKFHHLGLRSIIVEHAWADSSYAMTLSRGLVDGVVVADPSGTEAIGFLGVLREMGMPLVTHGMEYEATIPTVNPRFAQGMAAVMQHLADLGHRRVAFIGQASAGGTQRYDGYLQRGSELGMAVGGDLVVQTNPEAPWTYAAGHGAARELLSRATGATAVVAASDLVALGAMRAIGEAGLCIPRDLSIVGWDDVPQAAYTWPGLTTVRVDREAIAERLADALVAIVGGHTPDVSSVSADLIVRESTGRPQ